MQLEVEQMANLYETLVEPRLPEVKKWSGEGATMKEIAKKLGVSYSGFKGYKNKYPELEAALLENRGVADDKVLGAFFKSATGYETKEITKERIDGKMVTTKEVTKQVAPNVEAGKFWLKNRMPEDWKDSHKYEVSGMDEEKSKLSSLIQQMTGEDDE